MFDGFKEWFNALSGGKKFAFIIGIIAIIVIIVVGIVFLSIKLSKKQENFAFSNEYHEKADKPGVGSIAEAYTAAWIASLKS